MSNAVELRPDRRVDFGDAMAVDVAPEAGNAVEISIAVAVDEVHPVRIGDDELLVGEPLPHMGEGMPDMLAVQFPQLAGVHRISTRSPARRPSFRAADPSRTAISSK